VPSVSTGLLLPSTLFLYGLWPTFLFISSLGVVPRFSFFLFCHHLDQPIHAPGPFWDEIVSSPPLSKRFDFEACATVDPLRLFSVSDFNLLLFYPSPRLLSCGLVTPSYQPFQFSTFFSPPRPSVNLTPPLPRRGRRCLFLLSAEVMVSWLPAIK